jgi:hypothetical protein
MFLAVEARLKCICGGKDWLDYIAGIFHSPRLTARFRLRRHRLFDQILTGIQDEEQQHNP